MVAGALKSIEEVKKLARHSSSQAAHHNNFFDSLTGQLCVCVRLCRVRGRLLQPCPADTRSARNSGRDCAGWGDKKRLEEGWKLTHGAESVHDSGVQNLASATHVRTVQREQGMACAAVLRHAHALPLAV